MMEAAPRPASGRRMGGGGVPVGDLFDYLRERGGLPLAQAPFGPVDALILSALSYVQLDGPADFSAGLLHYHLTIL